MRNNLLTSVASVFALGLASTVLCERAVATPISGEISFSGSYTVNNPNLVTASEFDSFSGVTVSANPTGDYSGTGGTDVTFTPFSWDAFVPVTPAWTFIVGPNTYSFDYSSLTIDYNSSTVLVLSGTGLASITGFDDTPGIWSITANTFGTTFSFSSTSATVPDGGVTLAMLGAGIVGLAYLSRRNRA